MFSVFKEQIKRYHNLSSQFDLVKNWLVNSGLGISDPLDKNCGGVHSFYDEQKKEYAFLYPEITGYYLSTLCFLFKKENEQIYKNLATNSANWLIEIFNKYGGIVQGISTDQARQNTVYSFDIAICAKGLMDYYLVTKNDKFLDYSKKMELWLIENALENDGTIKPMKDLQKNEFLENTDVWYKQKGCFAIKTVMPIVQLYKVLKDPKLLEAINLICSTCLIYQNDNGSFSLHKNGKIINLHTLCYAVEGLLFAYHLTKNEKYLLSCKAAVNWCTKNIKNDGSINLWFNSKHNVIASYPIAQLLRIMILLDKLEDNSNFKQQEDKLYKYLISFQASSLNSKIDGGFYEETYKSIFGWKKRLNLNSWTSMFSLQALYWYDNYDKISFEKEIEFLY